MSNSEWRLLCVFVTCAESEIVSDYLWSRGVVAIEEINHGDQCELRTSYGDEVSQLARDVALAFPEATVSVADAQRDIADTWRDFAEPINVDSTLRIVPSWHVEETPAGCVDILIDPEDVFGLGNHPTTIGALQIARKHIPTHSSLFDYGSGSGVLAIAMAKTHRCDAAVYDIADSAEDVITRNARRNNIELVWRTPHLDSQTEEIFHKYDAVLANILAPVLREIAPSIRAMTRIDSLIVLSGMREEQWETVWPYYTWCDVVDQRVNEGWLSVCLQVID